MSTPKYSRLDPGQRRTQILDAANPLFAERAYDDVTIEDIASAAGVTRGLVHHYFGGRKDVYIGLLERLGAQREQELRAPVGRSARARVADSVSRWLDWTEANRTIWLATIAPGEDIADPEVRQVVADLVRRAVARLAEFHADIAEDSPRLRHALECWTGLTAPRHDAGCRARPTAKRRTSCSPPRSSTSYAPSAPDPPQAGAHLLPERRPATFGRGLCATPRQRRRTRIHARTSNGNTTTTVMTTGHTGTSLVHPMIGLLCGLSRAARRGDRSATPPRCAGRCSKPVCKSSPRAVRSSRLSSSSLQAMRPS
jgi:AcrR family transcriptional regulator